MTQKVSPSVGHAGSAFETASAIRYGALSPGWIVPDTEANLSLWDTELADGPLEAFDAVFSGSTLSVTIQSGEGYVNGAWVAKDQPTELDPTDPGGLEAHTANQVVYLGYALFASDFVKIGTEELFDPQEPRIPLWEFSTNGTGVTEARNLRALGHSIDVQNRRYDADHDGDGVVREAEYAEAAGHADTASRAATANEAGHADTADYATTAGHAETADYATTAGSAETISDISPSELVRGSVTVNFPVALLEAGEKYHQVESVPSNTTFRLLSVSLMTDSGQTASSMQFHVTTTGGTSLWSTSSKRSSGTFGSPLYGRAGPQDLLLGIHNTSSSTDRRASARATYFIDPD